VALPDPKSEPQSSVACNKVQQLA